MALHFITHPWEVQDFDDRIVVKYTARDLDEGTAAQLTDELTELAMESGRPALHLDLSTVYSLPSLVLGRLFALDRRLHAIGCRLVLCNLSPLLGEVLQVVRWPENQVAGPARNAEHRVSLSGAEP